MSRKKTSYIIKDGVIIFDLHKKTGENFKCYADEEDLPLLINHSWHLRYAPNNDKWYANATKYLGFVNGMYRYESLHMHKIILGIPKDSKTFIDHINHDTLDNRKENLRLSENIQNTKNRKSKNTNNTSGYRNVSWLECYQKWCVQLQINRKNTLLGKFTDVDEAGKFAEEMRQKYYKEFKGIG